MVIHVAEATARIIEPRGRTHMRYSETCIRSERSNFAYTIQMF